MRANGLAGGEIPPLTRLELLRRYAIAFCVTRPPRTDEDLGHLRDARNGMRELLGDDHPSTLAARLSLALGVDAIGGHRTAVREARACLAGYERAFVDGHPFIQLCRLDLSGFLVHDGAAGEAAEIADRARDSLDAALGPVHPWTLAADLLRARAKAACGRDEEAAGIVDATFEDALEYLGPDHPYTEAARVLTTPGTLTGPLPVRLRPALYLDIPII